jgi:hypothetical protein
VVALFFFVNGCHQGKSGDTTIDMQRLVENAAKLEEYCTKNPDFLMMHAAETVLEPQN